MRSSLARALPALVLAAAAPSVVADLIEPYSQDRSVGSFAQVETTEDIDTDDAFDQAPGFGLYDQSASASASVSPFDASGVAEQYSYMLPTVIGAAGGAAALSEDAGSGATQANAGSLFDVYFTITEEHTFRLVGGLIASDVIPQFDSSASVTLSQVGVGVIYSNETSENDTPVSVLHDGLFTPGDYQLTVYALASSLNDASSSASFDIRLIVPEPASATLALIGLLAGTRRRA